MKKPQRFVMDPVIVVLTILIILLIASITTMGWKARRMRGSINARRLEYLAQSSAVPSIAEATPAHAVATSESVSNLTTKAHRLFSSEVRVVAIGSAYPIPYDAEICPYSSIPQPRLNQLDRDGDGMTDDWEIKYGLDKYNAADAEEDPDKDGFTNAEEFKEGSNPVDAVSHPPYALKLRFVDLKEIPFPLVFQGSSTLPDGRTVFQINTPANGRTHFLSLGDSLEGIVLERFVKGSGGTPDELIVRRRSTEVSLPRSKKIPDPESQAELINILDHSREVVTMYTLLSVDNDEYTVLGIYQDKVVLKSMRTGEVFDIVGLNVKERESLLRESE